VTEKEEEESYGRIRDRKKWVNNEEKKYDLPLAFQWVHFVTNISITNVFFGTR
jgi:hypothetical protein